MSKLTYQQRGNQNTRIPVSQRRTAGGKVLEDNRAAFAAKQLKQGETAQRVEEEDVLLKGKPGTKQLAKKDEEEIDQAKSPDRGPPVQREQHPAKPNNTGLPDKLKNGVESLSGMSMDNVKVHYNSAKPQQLNALAYAQGTDIHVGPGQEKHLPHEAWHVVQQAQGRVRPTMQMKGNVPVNDDKGLEHEADVMGKRAEQMQANMHYTRPATVDIKMNLRTKEAAKGVLQGVFTFDLDQSLAKNVYGDKVKNYRILEEVQYDGDKTAYHLENIDEPFDEIYVDATGNEIDSTEIVKNNKRKCEVEEDSDYSESDDDDRSTLTHFGMLRKMIKKGKHKKQRLIKTELTKEKEKKKKKAFNLNTLEKRKALAMHRINRTKGISNIDDQEYPFVGNQKLHIGAGTGFFIMAGGNLEERPKSVKEPSAEYHQLFPEMQKLGKDKAAKVFYQKATKLDLEDTEDLSDRQIASMALMHMNEDVDKIEEEVGERTQLTENLSKFAMISGFSEFSRSMNSQEEPYDSTLLIKQGLLKASQGEYSLQNMFFQGTGGENSIFLGAPSKTNAPSKIGGSEVLQNPFEYPERLKRQMDIFPKKKSDFKASLNSLKSSSGSNLLEISEEKSKQYERLEKEQQVNDVETLIKTIKDAEIPRAEFDRMNFWSSDTGFIRKTKKDIARMKERCEDNEDALKKLKKATKELEEKQKEAMK